MLTIAILPGSCTPSISASCARLQPQAHDLVSNQLEPHHVSIPMFSASTATHLDRYESNFATRHGRERILAFEITYCGFEDLLQESALGQRQDVGTSGVCDTSRACHVLWQISRDPFMNRDRSLRVMEIGVRQPSLKPLLETEILSIRDVTDIAMQHCAALNRNKQAAVIALYEGIGEEELPVQNPELEWKLGMH